MSRKLYQVLFSLLTIGTLLSVVSGGPIRGTVAAKTPEGDDIAAAAAFEAIVPVLHHPRCMNCHSVGDYPRQADDRHPHTMKVRRGTDGFGTSVMRCNACHQDHNIEGLHSPPGAPGWHLPSPEMPMIWEGRSDHDLCESLKDPKQNGGRSMRRIAEHMRSPLVLWGWHPGEGREPIPLAQETFLKNVSAWVDEGSGCPK